MRVVGNASVAAAAQLQAAGARPLQVGTTPAAEPTKPEQPVEEVPAKTVEELLAEQSQEPDIAKRKQIVWQIEKVLAEDVARPIIFHNRTATCWHPHFKGHVLHQNAIYNNWRFESVWLDK